MRKTLALIAAALALMLASFIWFVATWDASERPALTQTDVCFFSSEILRGPGQRPGPTTDQCARIT